MDSGGNIELCHTYPVVYKVEIEKDSFEQTLQLLVEDILQESPCYKAESAIVNYITKVIDPVGWKAVWRATQNSLGFDTENDFIVEVVEVSLVKLEADVIVKSVIVPDSSDVDLSDIEFKFKYSNSCVVPVAELYPISEDPEEELLIKTAVAIEHVRLFYDYLCRPWELEDNDDVCYTEELLRPRLQLYFDMKHKVLPEMMITKIENIRKEGWSTLHNLKALYEDMNVSDSESELHEDDVLKTLEYRKKLEDLRMKMDVLENPALRTIMMKKYTSCKPLQRSPSEEQGPITYIVSPHLTFEMIASLNLDPQTVLKFDNSPERVLKSCTDGDTVLIFPGHYKIDMLGWLSGNTTVKGIGPCGTIKLDSMGSSEVFLNCDAPRIRLENLLLMSTKELVSAIVIHHGCVTMKECMIDSDGAKTGITILGGAELTMSDSEVCNAIEDGIQLRMSSTLSMMSSRIISCGQHAINIDVGDEAALPFVSTEVNISDSHVLSNEGCGIYVKSSVLTGAPVKVNSNDVSALNIFPWLKHNIENTVWSSNKNGDVGAGGTYKLITNVPYLPQDIS